MLRLKHFNSSVHSVRSSKEHKVLRYNNGRLINYGKMGKNLTYVEEKETKCHKFYSRLKAI